MCTKRLSVITMKGNSVFKENPFENNTYESRKIAYDDITKNIHKDNINLFFVIDYTETYFEKDYKSYTG